MRWFQGSIAEAIATSKARNAIFVVFIHGQDEVSQEVTRVVNDQRVSSKLESADFVAITLDSDSEAYRQFQQIYHLVPVPSLFFIGENGVPLEVIAGRIEEAELVRRIETVLEENAKKSKPEDKPSEPVSKNANVDLQSAAKEETEKPAQVASVGPEASSSTVAEAAASPVEVTAKVETSEPKEEPSPVSTEEKVDRAKELLETKRKQKQEEEEEKQRQKELERRKVGQDVQKLRRWQQDQELKQLKEDRQREKAEEAAARERILKQIAQDRAERAARNGAEKKATEQEAKKLPVQESTITSNVSRIQFRLPDGSAHSHNFEPTTTLAEVRTYAVTQLNLPFRDFLMSTTFPRREFTTADNNQTLRDLQLVPTGVILILPTSSGAVVTSSSQSYSEVFTGMVMSFLTPLFSLITYLRNLVFGGRGTGAGAGAATGGATTGSTLGANFGLNSFKKEASSQNSTGARRRKPAESSVHRQGNIHRLTNNRDSSDDENNTWNGNSTQQM